MLSEEYIFKLLNKYDASGGSDQNLHQSKVEAEGSIINSIKLFPKDLSWSKYLKLCCMTPHQHN